MELKDFFSRQREDVLNQRFISSGVDRDCRDVYSYINDVISIPYDVFLQYIKKTVELPYVISSDVPQFSSIDSAIDGICTKLHDLDARGYKFEEIGRILQPGRTDDTFANKKYGENHVKTAVELGLAIAKGREYYLSAIGYVFPSLTKYQQDQLLARTVLRNSLIFNVIYKALNNSTVNILEEISFLSESTAKRRKNNSLIFCRMIGLNKDIQVQSILDKIK